MHSNLHYLDWLSRSALFKLGMFSVCFFSGAALAQEGLRVPGITGTAQVGSVSSHGAAGVFQGISLAVTDKLSIESFFRSNSSVNFASTGVSSGLPWAAISSQTLMGQYRFGQDDHSFRPRLGAGLTYNFSSAQRGLGIANGLHNDNIGQQQTFARNISGVGIALELGASYALSKSWYLEGSMMKSFVRTSGSALAADLGSNMPGLKVDPLQFSFSVGFKFQ